MGIKQQGPSTVRLEIRLYTKITCTPPLLLEVMEKGVTWSAALLIMNSVRSVIVLANIC